MVPVLYFCSSRGVMSHHHSIADLQRLASIWYKPGSLSKVLAMYSVAGLLSQGLKTLYMFLDIVCSGSWCWGLVSKKHIYR